VFKSAFKYIISGALLWSCANIPRDNVLDPKNPDSYSKPLVLIEAFVNIAAPYNLWTLEGLQQIKKTYGGNLVIAEYHRDLPAYDDPYCTDSILQKFTNLQQIYVGNDNPIPRGLPDLFVNGFKNRVSGAADKNSVAAQISVIVEDLLSRKNYYTIQPLINVLSKRQLELSCFITLLGNRSANGLKVRAIFIKDYGQPHLRRVVLEMSLGTPLGKITAGAYKKVQLGSFSLNKTPDVVLLILTTDDERQVLQCVKQDL